MPLGRNLRRAAVMPHLVLALLCLFPERLAAASQTDAAVGRLLSRPASRLDPGLPAEAFGAWLRGVLPRGTALAFEINDCGEQAGEPDVDRAREIPACVAVEAEIVSRNRALQLLFERESLGFHSGEIFSPELEGVLRPRALSELPALLNRTLRPFPISCPTGTTLKVKEQHAGVFEWCEDGHGRKQGPYRSWFNTGLYLMEKGAYRDGRKAGAWIECDRFESCKSKSYPEDPAP